VQQRDQVFTLAATDMPIISHTSFGEILAIVDSGTYKHILQCRTLLVNAKETHVTVSSFASDTSRSTYSGDLLCTVRTEDGQLLLRSDTSSALVVPDAKRPLWSVRHAQLAGHEIVLGARPGLLLQGTPRYFVPFINCPEPVRNTSDGGGPRLERDPVGVSRGNLDEDLRRSRQSSPCMAFGALRMIPLLQIQLSKVERTGLWLIRLLPPPTLTIAFTLFIWLQLAQNLLVHKPLHITTPDFRITNAWDTSHSNACVNSTSTA
jgi:hypothetical protein